MSTEKSKECEREFPEVKGDCACSGEKSENKCNKEKSGGGVAHWAKHHKVLLSSVLGLVALVCTACTTSPTRDAHEAMIKKVSLKVWKNNLAKDTTQSYSMLPQEFYPQLFEGIFSIVISKELEYKNYGVCSACYIHAPQKTAIASFGCFGKVWTFDFSSLISNGMEL